MSHHGHCTIEIERQTIINPGYVNDLFDYVIYFLILFFTFM